MEYRSREELARVARLRNGNSRSTQMSQQERLQRWVRRLEEQPDRIVRTLYQTEYWPRHVRHAMRSNGTPLTVAFEDPVLRAEGLGGDSYGDAKRFFDLSDRTLHLVLCYCHVGLSMTAGAAAQRLRYYAPVMRRPGVLRRVLEFLNHGVAL